MIFTEDDLLVYAPGVSLTSDAFTGAIRRLEAIIESDLGAGRPLELQERIEKGEIFRNTQTFTLKQFPIVLEPEPNLRVRVGGSTMDYWRRGLIPGNWISLAPDQYQIDIDGAVFLHPTAIGIYSDTTTWGGEGSYPHQRGRYIQEKGQGALTSYEITYWAGFDWSEATPEVEKIKAAAGAILAYIQTSGAFAGISEVMVPFDEFRIKYAIGSTSSDVIGKIPNELLRPFRDLRERSAFA